MRPACASERRTCVRRAARTAQGAACAPPRETRSGKRESGLASGFTKQQARRRPTCRGPGLLLRRVRGSEQQPGRHACVGDKGELLCWPRDGPAFVPRRNCGSRRRSGLLLSEPTAVAALAGAPRVSKSASSLYSCFGLKAAVSAACSLLLVAVMAKRSGMGSGDRGPGTIDGMAIWRFIDGRVVGEWWVTGTLMRSRDYLRTPPNGLRWALGERRRRGACWEERGSAGRGSLRL